MKMYIERYHSNGHNRSLAIRQPFEWLSHPFTKIFIRSIAIHVIRESFYPFTNRYAFPFERLIRCTSQFSNGFSVHRKVINCNTCHITKWLISSQTAAPTSHWMVNPLTNCHIFPLSSGICKIINPAIRINSYLFIALQVQKENIKDIITHNCKKKITLWLV